MSRYGKKEEENPMAYARIVKKEMARKQVKVQADFMATTQNDKQVKTLISQIEKPKDPQVMENLLTRQLSTQADNFKKKLELKRKKTLLSTSDLNDRSADIIKPKAAFFRQQTTVLSDDDRMDLTNPDMDASVDNAIAFGHVNLNDYNVNAPNEQNFLQCLDNSFDRVDKDKINEIDVGISFDAGNTSSYNQKLLKSRGAKHGRIFSDLKKNMDNFLTDFNYYFFEEIFQTVVLDIEKILEEKHKKILDISKNYNDNIKEYEFLMSSGKI